MTMKMAIFKHRHRSVYLLPMTSQSIADDAINALRDSIIVTRTRKVTSNSLDINFIHDHIQSRSCKNTVSLNIVIDILCAISKYMNILTDLEKDHNWS